MRIINQKGQSTVEYVLLLVVVVSLAAAFMNSDTFKKFVGKDSQLIQKLARQIVYSYRHGLNGDDESGTNYSGEHDT